MSHENIQLAANELSHYLLKYFHAFTSCLLFQTKSFPIPHFRDSRFTFVFSNFNFKSIAFFTKSKWLLGVCVTGRAAGTIRIALRENLAGRGGREKGGGSPQLIFKSKLLVHRKLGSRRHLCLQVRSRQHGYVALLGLQRAC